MYDFTNVDPVKCCTWLVLPTVYDESLSYGEQLNKFCKALNELIENNNNIPQYVAEMIQNYITSGAIDEVVRNILANYILNVKYPPKGITPAVGDGSADDTVAIQGCIDYAFNQGGGCVYLPYGKYLSRSLTLRSGVSLVGFDRYSTRIVQRGGDTKPLLSGGNVQNVQISNLTLDGNNEVQTDDLDVINVLGKDCLFTNLVIKSGFQCFVYNGLGGDLQVDNVVFGGAVKKVAVINGKDSVQFTNVKFNELGKVQGKCVLEVGASDGVYSFSSKAISPLCISVNGSRNTFNCDIINASNNFNDTGVMNNFNVLGMEVKEQLAQGKNISIGGNTTENITGNKTETVGSGKVENITGSKTETIGSGKVENITGSKTEVISENKSENITGNREIDIDGTDSIHVDGVSSVNIGGTRTEVFGSSRSVGVTGANTEEYHDTMTETFDSKHIVNGVDETNSFTGNINNAANKFAFESKQPTLPITFPDKIIDLYNIGNITSIIDITNCDQYGLNSIKSSDNTTTMTTKLQKILDFATDTRYVIFIPGTLELNITEVTGTRIRYIVSYGSINGNITFNYDSTQRIAQWYQINAVYGTITLRGFKTLTMFLNYANNFVIDGNGDEPTLMSTAYCAFYLQSIKNFTITGHNKGWVNENKFYNLRCENLTIESTDNDYHHNHNIFYGFVFEHTNVNIKNGCFNVFHDCRIETAGATDNSLTIESTCYDNMFYRSWYSSPSPYYDILQTGITVNNKSRETFFFNEANKLIKPFFIYNLSPINLPKNMTYNNNQYTTSAFVNQVIGNITLNENIYITVNGRFGIQLYDSNHNKYTDDLDSHIILGRGLSYSNGFISIGTNVKNYKTAIFVEQGAPQYFGEIIMYISGQQTIPEFNITVSKKYNLETQ